MIRQTDFVVEVRDRSLARHGVIPPEVMDFDLELQFNSVGSWTVRLPAEHPLAWVLRQPGSGVVVYWKGEPLISGPMLAPTFSTSSDDTRGTVEFTGVSDSIILGDSLAYPDPSTSDVGNQGAVNDVRNGWAETVMRAYVLHNIGPGATADRRIPWLNLEPNQERGNEVSGSARFVDLGTLLKGLGEQGGLGFHVVQEGEQLTFKIYEPQDRTGIVRFSMENNTLSGGQSSLQAPTLTRAVYGGAGRELGRLIREYQTEESMELEEKWGRRIERFFDQRDVGLPVELEKAAMESLKEEAVETVAVQAVPSEDMALTYGVDWGLGDFVTLELDGSVYETNVTGVVIKVDSDGYRMGAQLGDPTKIIFSEQNISTQIAETKERISHLERTGENTGEITRGDFSIYNGGNLVIWDTGQLQIRDGGEVRWFDSANNERINIGKRYYSDGSSALALTFRDEQEITRAAVGTLLYSNGRVGYGIATHGADGWRRFESSEEQTSIWNKNGNVVLWTGVDGDDEFAMYSSTGQYAGGYWRTTNNGYQLDCCRYDGTFHFAVNSDGMSWADRADDLRFNMNNAGLTFICSRKGEPLELATYGGGHVKIGAGSGDGRIFLYNLRRTGGGALMRIGAGGQVFRDNSSRRFKTDIEDEYVDPEKFLAMQPRSWRDLEPLEEDVPYQRYTGYIAEEVADLGLEEFVAHDEDGLISSLNYDRLAAVAVNVVGNHLNDKIEAAEKRADEAEERVSALEARLAALETALTEKDM